MLDTLLLAGVARQVFEGQKTVTTPSGTARVTTTFKQGLRKVEFAAGDERLVGIEQNPHTASRWARLAREGHQVMQFRDARTSAYVAVVVDGKATLYPRHKAS
ncbi:MAG: hypothetical protein ABSA70_05510 [Terriglobia bacterium]